MGYIRRGKRLLPEIQHKITVYIDDREKDMFSIPTYIGKTERVRLETGDYIFESTNKNKPQIVIEKKSGWHEFIQNISGMHRKRFEKCLERLSQCEKAYFVICDDVCNVDKVLRKIPKTNLDVRSVFYWLYKISFEYDIPVILIGGEKQKQERNLEYMFEQIYKRLT